MTKSAFNEAIDRGYGSLPIIPLRPRSKIPCVMEWSKYCHVMPTQEEVEKWKTISGAGVTLPLGEASGVIALDFDYDVDDLHTEILKLVPVSPVRKVGMKGYTMFYKYRGEKPHKWAVGGEMCVELLSSGNHTVLPPSVHPETGDRYRYSSNLELVGNVDRLPTLPEDLVNSIDALVGKKSESAESVPNNIAISEATRMLEFIDSGDYQQWIYVGMALKDAYGEEGFSLWDAWSRGSDKYNSREMYPKWKSFTKDGTSIATIIYYAKTNGYNPPQKIAQGLIVSIDDVKGTLEQWRIHGRPTGESFGWGSVDRLIHLRRGEFTIITGYANQGKSEFMDSVGVNMMKNLNLKVGFISMEKSKENHVATLIHKLSGKPLDRLSDIELNTNYNFLTEYASIVNHLDMEKNVSKVFEVIEYLVTQKHVDSIIIDPFNYIESDKAELYNHVMKVLKGCTNIAKRLNIYLFLVAHAKDPVYNKDGSLAKPRMYSVFGGTQVANIADNIISVNWESDATKISTLKIREQDTDKIGVISLYFNKDTRGYDESKNESKY